MLRRKKEKKFFRFARKRDFKILSSSVISEGRRQNRKATRSKMRRINVRLPNNAEMNAKDGKIMAENEGNIPNIHNAWKLFDLWHSPTFFSLQESEGSS